MVLSIGIMTKNEEKYLEKCLIGLQPILNSINSELIIVDTGSTDKTVEIAKKYTKNVYYHKWSNDFSDIRNKVLSYCTGKWFLFIDADEIFANAEDLISFFSNKEYDNYNSASIVIKSYCKDNDLSLYTRSSLLRLFKNTEDLKFIGKVHEQATFRYPIKYLKSTVDHYGYISDDAELMERKFIRNKKLILEELENKPNNVYLNFQLSKTYNMYGKLDKALEIIEKAYNTMNKNQKIYYKYIFAEYAKLLIRTKNYIECERICEKELKLIKNSSLYKIDLYNYLGKSKCLLMKYKESIDCFNKYFKLINELDEGKIQLDITAVNDTYINQNEAHNYIIYSYVKLKKYEEAIHYFEEQKDIFKLDNNINKIIQSYIRLRDYNSLYNLYKDEALVSKEENKRKFIEYLEMEKIKLSKEDNLIIEKLFAQNNDNYGLINKIRISEEVRESYKKLLSNDNRDEFYYGELLYIALKEKYNIIDFMSKKSYYSLYVFINYCNKKYKNSFYKMLFEYCNTYTTNDFDSLRVKIIFLKSILVLDKMNDEEYYDKFNEYQILGRKFIKYIYSDYVIKNEIIYEMKNSEHEFFMYMEKAGKLKHSDKSQYLEILKKAIIIYPEMKRGIKNMIAESGNKKNQINSEMELLKRELIESIKILIKCNKKEEAKIAINEYEKFMEIDLEILNLKKQLSDI